MNHSQYILWTGIDSRRAPAGNDNYFLALKVQIQDKCCIYGKIAAGFKLVSKGCTIEFCSTILRFDGRNSYFRIKISKYVWISKHRKKPKSAHPLILFNDTAVYNSWIELKLYQNAETWQLFYSYDERRSAISSYIYLIYRFIIWNCSVILSSFL